MGIYSPNPRYVMQTDEISSNGKLYLQLYEHCSAEELFS